MTVDTSVVVAILRKESGYDEYVRAIVAAETAWISSVNLLETYMVLGSRSDDVTRFIEEAGIKVWDFTRSTALIAHDAFLHYGKGRHKASLNICDCAAYATTKETGAPLLYKGNDFTLTDLGRVPSDSSPT